MTGEGTNDALGLKRDVIDFALPKLMPKLSYLIITLLRLQQLHYGKLVHCTQTFNVFNVSVCMTLFNIINES